MKRLMKFFVLTVVFTMTVIMAAPVQAEAAVRLSKRNAVILKGKSFQLKLKGTAKKVTWKSTKKSVASIKKKSKKVVKVTAKKIGKATIVAKIKGKKYKCSVKVINPKLSKTKASLRVGQQAELKVSGGNGTTTWSSANTAVARVSKKGKVTAVSAGTAVITAKNSGKTMKCTITVSPNTTIPTSKFLYDAELSHQYWSQLNNYRLAHGKPAVKEAANMLLKLSVIRACYNLDMFNDTKEIEDLFQHASPQLGLGGVREMPSASFSSTDTNLIDYWLSSPLYLSYIMEDFDYMAVAVVQSGNYQSVIVSMCGESDEDTYSIDGVNRGEFSLEDAPLYGYTIHREGRDIEITREYIERVELGGVPSGLWAEYLAVAGLEE